MPSGLRGTPFPLFHPRKHSREYTNPLSPWHLRVASIPFNPQGRIIIQLTIPGGGIWNDMFILPLAVSWPKTAPLRSPRRMARLAWRLLRRTSPRRSRTGYATFSDARMGALSVYVPRQTLRWIPHIPEAEAIGNLNDAIAWVGYLLTGTWPSDQDRWTWIYRAHRQFAMPVADEVARSYLVHRTTLLHRGYLEQAHAQLVAHITQVYGSTPTHRPRVITARRLALALVDVKFQDLLPPLLAPGRAARLEDARLWSLVLPRRAQTSIRHLWPAGTVA
jgi:hypothetical protein